MSKQLTIIMVGYKFPELTEHAIKSLCDTTNPDSYKLIFVDNGDAWPGNMFNYTEEKDWGVKELVRLFDEGNNGWIKPINAIIKEGLVNTDYFLTCHTDIIFEKDWLPKMMKRFNNDNKVAMVGPTSNFIFGLQSTQYNHPAIITEQSKFICGLFCIFKKDAIDTLIAKDDYFMDERFGLGDKEELDYAIRLTKLGYIFKIARDVFIQHEGEKSFVDKLGSQKAFHEYQDANLCKLIYKHSKEIIDKLYEVDFTKRINIVSGTPIRNNYIHYKFWASSCSLQKIPTFQYVTTVRHIIQEARNEIVRKALELNATHLLFIDDDMIFPSDAALRLLHHDKDIVCGLAFRRRKPYDPCIFRHIGNNIHPIEAIKKGLVEIDACGSAFILIKMEVFKKLSEPWYVFGDKSLGVYENVGGLGEDIGFSLKAKQEGFEVFCDTDLIVTHIGDEEEVDDTIYLKHRLAREANGEKVLMAV